MKITKNTKRLITEMDSAMLGGIETGGSIGNSDSYAPGDNRIPRILSPIQKRKRNKKFVSEEDEEDETNDTSSDDDLEDLRNKLAAGRAYESKLIDLDKKDWNKITEMVNELNLDFFEAIKKYYRKKFGENIKIDEISKFFDSFYSYGNRPLGE